MSRAKALPILMYHHVSPASGLVTVSPDVFRSQIASLAVAGWKTIGATDIERFFRGEPMAPRTCVITFDDGYLDNYFHAYPVLQEFGMTALLFVVTGWLGDGMPRKGTTENPNHAKCMQYVHAGEYDSAFMRWSEAEIALASGVFEFHSHTHSHTRWDKIIDDSGQRASALTDDLHRSRTTLQSRLGACSSHLCWPQGYYDESYVAVAHDCGFSHLYTTLRRINTPKAGMDAIGRLSVKARADDWLTRRVALYARPLLGRLYAQFRGEA